MSAMCRRLLCVLTLLALSAPFADAQMDDPQQEQARQLVERIRRSMREIDQLLLSRADSRVTTEKVDENITDMEKLLRESESKAKAVIRSLEELMDIAQQQQQQQQQSGSGQDQSDQQNQNEQQGQNQPERQKSQDPQELQRQEDQTGQQEQGEDQEQPEPNDQPQSGKPNESPARQEDAQSAPPAGETGQFELMDTSGRWGLLPPKQAEDLQRRQVEDFPQRYRYWMEMYYRRVNRRDRN